MCDLIRFTPPSREASRSAMVEAGALCVGCDVFSTCKALCDDVKAILYPTKSAGEVIRFKRPKPSARRAAPESESHFQAAIRLYAEEAKQKRRTPRKDTE